MLKSGTIEENKAMEESKKRTHSTRWSLGSLALSMLLSSLGISITNVALPTFAQVFTASFQEVQWVVIAYLLAITIMIVSVGRLGDIMGHRRVLLTGIALFTVASILCALAPTLWILIFARTIQGIGASILLALTVALVRATVPKEKTGSAMGLLGTMSAFGTALGPTLGGVLLAGSGWQAIFLILVPLGVVNFFLAHRYLAADEQRRKLDRMSFDVLGTLLLGLTLAAYALAVTIGGGRFNQLNIILLIAAVLGGGIFLLVEANVVSPLIQLREFRNAVLSTTLAMNVLVTTVMMATLVVGPFYLSNALGLNEALVGIVMSIGPIIAALSGVPSGRIVDRFGGTYIVIIGLITMATGSFALSVLPELFGIAGYVFAIAILTPGYQLFQAANNTTVMMDVSSEKRGVISGMLSLSRNLGLITGASVMGTVFAFASMASDFTVTKPNDVTRGMRGTFTVAGCLIIVAVCIAFINGVRVRTYSTQHNTA